LGPEGPVLDHARRADLVWMVQGARHHGSVERVVGGLALWRTRRKRERLEGARLALTLGDVERDGRGALPRERSQPGTKPCHRRDPVELQVFRNRGTRASQSVHITARKTRVYR